MSRSLSPATSSSSGFPRVSGDEPVAEQHVNTDRVFSPRERG